MLIVCVTFLTGSCTSFDWDAQPWSGHSASQSLVKYTGEIIKCDQPEFERMTCFDEINMAELKTEIDRVSSKKIRNKMLRIFKKTKRKH